MTVHRPDTARGSWELDGSEVLATLCGQTVTVFGEPRAYSVLNIRVSCVECRKLIPGSKYAISGGPMDA